MSNLDQDIKLDIKSGTILVVDDEPSNVLLLNRMLTANGYSEVLSTTNSLEVLGICTSKKIDLMLLDINMPDLDGFGVLEQMKTLETATRPVILVLSAQNMQEARQKALDNGARDYVAKPFNVSELLSRVRNLLEMKLLQDRMRNQNQDLEAKVIARTADLIAAHKHLQETRLQVIQRLGRAAEYRDNETGYHIIRMSKISELLGRSVGLSEDEAYLLLIAAPMHDIGKIGIPDQILLKPGKLNADEWEIMKTHAQIGADMLSGDDSDLLVTAHQIALNHHEKWDGSGYPRGLSGEAIPLMGRIAAVADVFDALTSERPYKKAWPIDDAIRFIKEQSGQHFDPELVNHFLNNLEEIIRINETYAEPVEFPILPAEGHLTK